MEAKFEICCHCKFLQQDTIGSEQHQHLCRLSPNLSSYGDSSLGWLDVSLASLVQSIPRKVFSRLWVHKQQENTPCLRDRCLFTIWSSWGITRVCLMNGKLKIKVKVVEAVGGAVAGGSGKSAAVQIGYSQWGLLGCSPLKVLQSLNLSHVQSLRWRIHRKT